MCDWISSCKFLEKPVKSTKHSKSRSRHLQINKQTIESCLRQHNKAETAIHTIIYTELRNATSTSANHQNEISSPATSKGEGITLQRENLGFGRTNSGEGAFEPAQ